jgi:hypothetical protein
MSVAVLAADQLVQLAESGDPATCYIASMVRNGPQSYIDNAKVRMEALLIEGKILPLVINDGVVGGNSNVCSASAHYVEYASYEFTRRFGRLSAALLSAPRSLLGAAARAGSLDRLVFVNNWLLSTNPRHGLSSVQVARLTQYLTQRYPHSAIVFRSVNSVTDKCGFDALCAADYMLVPSRTIYILDTANDRYLEHGNVDTDLAMLRRTPYAIVDARPNLAPLAARFAALYRDLYIGRYSSLNPRFNERFFSLILEREFMGFRAFETGGQFDAFISYLVEDGVLTASLIAYDLNRPQKLGLYRMCFALMIDETARRKGLVNLSAGVGHFKMLRGAMSVQEYDAVYHRHLPVRQRLTWTCLRRVAQLGRLLSSNAIR